MTYLLRLLDAGNVRKNKKGHMAPFLLSSHARSMLTALLQDIHSRQFLALEKLQESSAGSRYI